MDAPAFLCDAYYSGVGDLFSFWGIFPATAGEVGCGEDEGDGPVDEFGAPGPEQGSVVFDHDEVDVDAVACDGGYFDAQIDSGVAGAGDGVEPDAGGGHEEDADGDHSEDRDGGLHEGFVLVVDAEEGMGEDVEQDANEYAAAHAEDHDSFDEGEYLVGHALSDDVADHGVGGGCEGPCEDAEEANDVAHGIGDGEVFFAMVFDEDVEE